MTGPKRANRVDTPALLDSRRTPHVVTDGNAVTVVKVRGDAPVHRHDDTGDVVLVPEREAKLDGAAGASVTQGQGERCAVPRGPARSRDLPIEPRGGPDAGDCATAAPNPRI